MKNDEQMYQSLLARYERYREAKRARARMLRHAVPVLACFCLAVMLGVAYRHRIRDLPPIPTQPPVTGEMAATTTVTMMTALTTVTRPTVQTSTETRPIPTAAQMTEPPHPAATTAQTVRTLATTPMTMERQISAAPDLTEARVHVVTTAAPTDPPEMTTAVPTDPPEMTTAAIPADTTEPRQTSVTIMTAATTGVVIATGSPGTAAEIDMTGTGTGSASTQTETTTQTTVTTVFRPDPNTSLRVREQMAQLITRYSLGEKAWVVDAAAYPQYPDAAVIEFNERGTDRLLRIYAIAYDIDTRYLTFVYCDERAPVSDP